MENLARQTAGQPSALLTLADVRAAAERIAFVRTLSLLHSLRAPPWFRLTAFGVSAVLFLGLGGTRQALKHCINTLLSLSGHMAQSRNLFFTRRELSLQGVMLLFEQIQGSLKYIAL